MNKKIIAFNWKMNPTTLKEATALAKISDSKNIIVIPPFIFIEEIGKILKKSKLGAQNIFYELKGAFTGEISANELKKIGVEYVIIGHSERRQILGETDKMVNKKVSAALKTGLKVILCVGEPLRSIKYKVESIKQAKNYIKKQLKKDLKGIHNSLIIAYEPIWAIGTGHSDTAEDAAEMIKYIKQTLKAANYKLKIKVLYGGSVDSQNIKQFLKHKEIDGFLVGSASLKKEEIKKIIYEMEKNSR